MRCEQRYRNDEMLQKAIQEGELALLHEHSRWTVETLACQYVHWLHRYYRGQPIALLWHIFAAHRCNEVKKLAPELKIELEFIPGGMTGDC
jgi:hypothetical protein